MIHPTAVIDPRAELGPNVSVAPYAVIGPEVRLGAGTEIGAHVVLEGRLAVGARCRIGHGALIGGLPQDFKYRPGSPVGVRIGDDTVIRELVTIHRATRDDTDTRVGDHCLVMAASHVAHDCVLGNHVIVINYAGLTGHVVVGDHATVGGHTGIHPAARIGAYAYVGGCAKVHQDVPPFTIVDGAPATARSVNVIGMRRGGIDPASRRAVQSAFRVLYRSGLAPAPAIERLRSDHAPHPLVDQLIAFIESTKLGIVSGGTKRAATEGAELEERIL
jgi:UDP-N-acetylglucosamine acyltransferase